MTAEEFLRLTNNCQPHQVFKLDWSTYYTVDFARTFLPRVPELKGKAFHFFDGAELLKMAEKVDSNLMQLTKSKYLITTVFYTYPKGVLAENMKKNIQVDKFEICCFMEVHQNENVDVSFKFGKDFSLFLDYHIKEKKITGSGEGFESQKYSTTISKIKSSFNNEISHFNMLNFVGNTLGLNFKEVHDKSVLKVVIQSIKVKSSEQAGNKDINKKEKWLEVEFEVFNQATSSHTFRVYKEKEEIFQITFLPEVVVSTTKDIKVNKATDDIPTQQPGKYILKWYISKNTLFDTKDEKLKLTITIQASTIDKQTAIATKDFLVKEIVEKTEKNNFIYIVDPQKNESDEGGLIQLFGNEIIERQKKFVKQIPKEVYNKLSAEGKLILNLPIIMTKLDFLYGALCQIHWLEGSKTSLKFPFEFFMSEKRVENIDIKNLKEYFKELRYVSVDNLGYTPSNPDGVNLFLFNDSIPSIKNALEVFNKNLSKRTEGGEIGDYENLATQIGEKIVVKENLFQSFSMGSAFGDIDDVGTALGRYSQRCYFKAFLSKNTDTNKWILSIVEVACRFFDDFSFSDNLIDFGPIEYSQPLGCWFNDAEQVQLPTKGKIPGSSRVCLQNIDYQELKKILASTLPNSCNNFFIYSDLKILNDDFLQKDIIIF